MALLGNYSVLTKNSGTNYGGTAVGTVPTAFRYKNKGAKRGRYVGGIANTAATPGGARHPVAWVMAPKNGAVASQRDAEGQATTTATGKLGLKGEVTIAGTSTATATGSLTATSPVTIAGVATTTATLKGALKGEVVVAGTSTATAIPSALARGIVTTGGTATTTATLRGIGRLTVNVSPFTELSPQSLAAAVWSAVAASNNVAASMGEKLNAAGTAGDPWTAALSGYTSGQAGGIVATIAKLLRNKTVTDPAAGTITVYDDDGTTVLLTADLFEDAAGTTPYAGNGAERRERLT